MSILSPASGLVSPPGGNQGRGAELAVRGALDGRWEAWLDTQLDPDWRVGEWRRDWWLFTGDPAQRFTAIRACRTHACDRSVRAQDTFCRACDLAWRAGRPEGDTSDERQRAAEAFAASHLPSTTGRGVAAPRCTVVRDQRQCVRAGQSRGLCSGHGSIWRSRYPDMQPDQWARRFALPFTGPGPCPVPGCGRLPMNSQGLCPYHYKAWPGPNSGPHADRDPAQWARRQPPYLDGSQFSLITLEPLARRELLFGLQRIDAQRRVVDPFCMRVIVRAVGTAPTVLAARAQVDERVAGRANLRAKWEALRWAIDTGYAQFRGVDPGHVQVLDLRAIGLRDATGRRRVLSGTADLSVIAQLWLRGLLAGWAEAERPTNTQFRHTLRAATLASHALATRPGGGADPAALGIGEVSAVVEAFRNAVKADGNPYNVTTQRIWNGGFFTLIDYGRRSELCPQISAKFEPDRKLHAIRACHPADDETGKAVPEHVIAQLDAHLPSLGTGMVYGCRLLAAPDLAAMYQTVYVLLRDTGRRPEEIGSLHRDCLDTDAGAPTLVWNNHKSRRLRRRLPITEATAAVIRGWQTRRDLLEVPTRGAKYLFPVLDRGNADHLTSPQISTVLRAWVVNEIPELRDDTVDTDGNPAPFDRTRIYPYAFRHAYAQRHADAGTPIDVLRELMDHRSVSSTHGYYQVSLKRKREAVTTLASHVINRSGGREPCSPDGGTQRYEMRTVAVPYGGCAEPSNVKAGGQACPIRFQCAGCGFYRPDPSYLPAIDTHLNQLRANRETAQAMSAAEFVTTALDQEITAYEGITATMRTRLAELPHGERVALEKAAAVLRKARLADPTKPADPTPAAGMSLPLTVINHNHSVNHNEEL